MTGTSSRRAPSWAGIIAISAAYVYFLLYAQFGFVSYLKQFHPDAIHTDRAMGMMGLGGLSFSFLAAHALRRIDARRVLTMSFAGCALASLLTLTTSRLEVLLIAAGLIGASAGSVTVTLASSLRTWITGSRFGLQVGIGTGLAYLICNIPAIFDAPPTRQTWYAALVCIPGMMAAWWKPRGGHNGEHQGAWLDAAYFRGSGFASVVMTLLALVWLDSTAFATIQLQEDLRSHTWGTPGMKLTLGFVHAVAAIITGWFIDRRRMRSLLVATFSLFAVAFTLLVSRHPVSWLSGPLYACGISIYSTVLVALPSMHPEGPGLVSLRMRAAILYAVAGWMGSGLGVGLAQHLTTLPGWLIAVAGVIVAAGCLHPASTAGRTWRKAYLLLAASAGLGFVAMNQPVRLVDGQDIEPSIEQGRRVYIQEGCIHCHSQYIRPHSPDVIRWGPYAPIDRMERPPLVGNRRQGPDLMHVGLRRTPIWHRQHLLDPRSLSPGSSMPSYAYLFGEGDHRGPSLVLYLSSLGIAHRPARMDIIRNWSPDRDATTPSPARGRVLFDRSCAMCHGPRGEADGPLSPIFNRPAMRLAKGYFQHVPAGLSDTALATELARIVTFGLPGFEMPGHETMSDRDLRDIVSYVRIISGSMRTEAP